MSRPEKQVHQNPIIQLSTQQGYDLWSSSYDDEKNPMLTLVDKYLNQLSLDVTTPTIAELGCGTGRNIAFFESLGAKEIWGFDVSQGMLDAAKQKHPQPHIHFTQHDIKKCLPLKDEEVDIVFISMTLEHIDNIQPIIEESYRILRPAGQLFIVEIHPSIFTDKTKAHFDREKEDQQIIYEMVSFPHQIDEFLNSGKKADFSLTSMQDIIPDSSDVAKNNRLEKFVGRPTVLALRFLKSS